MAAKKTVESSTWTKLEAEAQAVPKSELLSLVNVEINMARANIMVGRKNVLDVSATLTEKLKKPELHRVERLDVCATHLVDAHASIAASLSPSDTAKQLDRMWELRGILLPFAELLASMRLVPANEVAAIRKGRGALDGANDLRGLAVLYNKHHAKIREQLGPITPAMIAEAAELGASLGLRLRPSAAKKLNDMTKEQFAAHEARNRLFTILVRDYDHTWRLGALVFGRDVDAKVPPMMSRAAGKRIPKE